MSALSLRKARVLAVPAVLVVLVFSASCRRTPAAFPGAPLILVSIDTLRSDHLPAYGYRGVATPAIDALRRDAILFARAYSHYPMTFPAHASILSGELPTRHGVRDNAGYRFDAAQNPYLPQLLHRAGYATGAAVSSFVLRGATGLAAGFDLYDDHLAADAPPGTDPEQRPGAATVRHALDWVRGRGGRPFFLFVHLYEPHAPYEPPEPFASRYRASPYDGEIATADAALGELLAELKRLGIYDRAAVLLLSDHGEGLGEHGEEQHGFFLYRETLQVPLLLKLPGGRRGGTAVAAPAQLVDVVPTLLAIAGVAPPAGLPGQSLLVLPTLPDPAAPARRIYAETFFPRLHYGWSDLASLIEGRFHYVHGPAPELFDLAADPAETKNVLAAERRVYAELRQAVGTYPRELAAPAAVDAETARKLTALGYAGGGRVAQGALPDPRRERGVLRDLAAAKRLTAQSQYAAAAEILRRMTREQPQILDAWTFLGACLERLDRPQEALAAYRRALDLSSGAPEYALQVAKLLYRLGRLDEAGEHARLAVNTSPGEAYGVLAAVALSRRDTAGALAALRHGAQVSDAFRGDLGRALLAAGRSQDALDVLGPLARSDPQGLTALAHSLAEAGRPEEAAALLARLLAVAPRDARLHEALGEVKLRQGRPAEARAELEQALALDRGFAAAWNTLGVALYDLHQPDAALAAWQQAVALDGGQYDALLNLGLVAAQAGRRDEARQALRRFVATAPPGRFAADLRKAQQLLREIGG